MATLALPTSGRPTRPARRRKGMSPWQRWGLILLAPYALVFVMFVMYPVGYGLWLARHPASYEKLFEDPVFLRSVFNTLAFLVIAINVKMMVALVLSGFFVVARPWIKWLSLLFILPGRCRRSRRSCRSVHAEPRMGAHQLADLPLHRRRRPELAQRPYLALGIAMLVHIWKSLPFWTLILIAGRLAIPAEHYEAASVDGATAWQKFRFITWPSMRTLYLTCTILSMIFTMGDFNSVYC
jgi:multiple sugar transport system permease protein